MLCLPPNEQRQSTEGKNLQDKPLWIEAEMMGLQMDHMQVIFTSLHTDNHASTSSIVFTGRMLFLLPNQQTQSTEGRGLQEL